MTKDKGVVTVIEGQEITQPQRVYDLFAAGDFTFQLYTRKGPRHAQTCTTTKVRDMLAAQVKEGTKVVAQVPKKAGPAQK